jgi:hypothetical protein
MHMLSQPVLHTLLCSSPVHVLQAMYLSLAVQQTAVIDLNLLCRVCKISCKHSVRCIASQEQNTATALIAKAAPARPVDKDMDQQTAQTAPFMHQKLCHTYTLHLTTQHSNAHITKKFARCGRCAAV